MKPSGRLHGLAKRSYFLILFLLVLLPTSNFHTFNGIPFSVLVELIAIALLAPLLVSRGIRRLYSDLLFRRRSWLGVALVSTAVLGVLLKVLILISGVHTGFLGCYESPLAAPVPGDCEKSYENPFQRFDATRLDRELNFQPDGWGLTFVNSNRFNFHAAVEGNVLRDRLPFRGSWSSTVNTSDLGQMIISYTGEGEVRAGGETATLPPSYEGPNEAVFVVPPGAADIQVSYRYDDGYRVSGLPPSGPGATFKAEFPQLSGALQTKLAFGNASLGWLIAGWVVDGIVVASVGALATAYAWIIRRDLLAAAAVGVLAIGIYYYMPEVGPMTRERGLLLSLASLLILLALRPRRSRLLGAYFTVFLIVVLRSMLYQQDLSFVSVRPGGSDPLTYESQARTILDTFSLQGGEDIFYGQVFFRYFLFGLHFIFGDPDAFLAIAALITLYLAIFYAVYRWLPKEKGRGLAQLAVLVGGVLALALVNSWHLVWMVHYGASEYPTWIFTLIALPLLFSKKKKEWLLGALLLGLTWITRVNQAFAIILILAAHVVWLRKLGRGKAVWASFAVFLVVALLPGLHNAYFGGQFIPAPTYWDNRTNMILPPDRLARFFIEPDVRKLAFNQLKSLLVVHEDAQRYFGTIVAMRALLVAWLAALVYAVTRWRRVETHAWMLLALPLGYFAVQFFYNPYGEMYPRHFVMPYLAMGVVGMYLIHHLSTARTADEQV